MSFQAVAFFISAQSLFIIFRKIFRKKVKYNKTAIYVNCWEEGARAGCGQRSKAWQPADENGLALPVLLMSCTNKWKGA